MQSGEGNRIAHKSGVTGHSIKIQTSWSCYKIWLNFVRIQTRIRGCNLWHASGKLTRKVKHWFVCSGCRKKRRLWGKCDENKKTITYLGQWQKAPSTHRPPFSQQSVRWVWWRTWLCPVNTNIKHTGQWIDWLIGWLIDWLIDWVTYWQTE